MTEPKVELIGRARLLDDFFQVDAVDYRFERQDGRTSAPVRRLVLERGDSVAALLHQGPRLWLVEQLRIATWPSGPGWLLEVVAGIVGAGESPEAALRREVHEETGFEIEALDWLGSFYLSPGGSSERVHLALAEVGTRSGPGGGVTEEGEDILLVELTPDGLRDAWRQGRLVDAKTLIAAMAYFGARP
ncbi:MAG: NUDIX hydrolase [Burkholderiaceae bacterium]|nr:NUDIX hydrolase [Burkholderiaceae bacterium]